MHYHSLRIKTATFARVLVLQNLYITPGIQLTKEYSINKSVIVADDRKQIDDL